MTEEERAQRDEARKLAREAKRAANREAWRVSPLNANNQQQEKLEAAVEIEIEPPQPEETGSLAKLRGIMADSGAPLYRRIEAAEIVLSFELAPGSLAQVDAPPEQIAASAYRFLKAASDANETPEPLRFRALRALASIENARAIRSNAAAGTARREYLVNRINAARRSTLIAAGVWERVVADDAEWSIAMRDSFDEPDLPRLGTVAIASDGTGIAARLRELSRLPERVVRAHGEAVDAILLAVRASNRPDDWERLLRSRAS